MERQPHTPKNETKHLFRKPISQEESYEIIEQATDDLQDAAYTLRKVKTLVKAIIDRADRMKTEEGLAPLSGPEAVRQLNGLEAIRHLADAAKGICFDMHNHIDCECEDIHQGVYTSPYGQRTGLTES